MASASVSAQYILGRREMRPPGVEAKARCVALILVLDIYYMDARVYKLFGESFFGHHGTVHMR